MNPSGPDASSSRIPLILSVAGLCVAVAVTLVLVLPSKPDRSRDALPPDVLDYDPDRDGTDTESAPVPTGFAARLAKDRARIRALEGDLDAQHAIARALFDAAPPGNDRLEALRLRRAIEEKAVEENARRLEETRKRAERLLREDRPEEALEAIAAYRPACDRDGTWAKRAARALDPLAVRAGWPALRRKIDACLEREAIDEALPLMQQARTTHAAEAEEALTAWNRRIDAIRGREASRKAEAARRKRFEAKRPDAERRVREARERVAREAREGETRDRRLEKALRDATQSPMRLRLGPALVLEAVRVQGYAGRRIRLAWPEGELAIPIERLPADTLAVLLSQAAADAPATDLLYIGAIFLRARQWDRAEGSFRKARRTDPALAPRCPNVERLRRADRLIRWNDGALATPRILALYQDAFATELARIDRTVNVEQGDTSRHAMALSLDDELPGLPPVLASHYQSVLDLLILRSRDPGLERFTRAREATALLARSYPTFAPPAYHLGRLAEQAESRSEAARWYDEALARCADFPEALASQARLRALAGDWPKARELVEHTLRLQPDQPDARLILARILIQEGRTAEALEEAGVTRLLAPRDASLRRRCRMLANVARGPGWAKEHRHATTHYRLRSDLSLDTIRAIGEDMEAVHALYTRLVPPARPDMDDPVEVLLFKTAEGYLGYVEFVAGDRLENVIGIYNPWYGQLMGFAFRDPGRTRNVLFHEAFHHYLDRVLPAAPIWLQEGMAEYVGGAPVEGGRISGPVRIQTGRLQDLRTGIRNGWRPRPFREIMTESQLRFYAIDPEYKYAQAWSMVYFLLRGGAGRWHGVLQAYLHRLAAGDTPTAAFDATFARMGVAEMEAAWRDYLRRL